jgi:hypothetical protein
MSKNSKSIDELTADIRRYAVKAKNESDNAAISRKAAEDYAENARQNNRLTNRAKNNANRANNNANRANNNANRANNLAYQALSQTKSSKRDAELAEVDAEKAARKTINTFNDGKKSLEKINDVKDNAKESAKKSSEFASDSETAYNNTIGNVNSVAGNGFMESFGNIKEGFFNTISIDDSKLTQNLKHQMYRDTEFLAQEDNIMSKILMDYMINESPGSNVETVYKDLKQKQNDNLRKINIKNYYTQVHKEYIHILKFVTGIILLMIPIFILNRLEILGKNMTLLIVIALIFIAVLYTGYRFYLLYLKDDHDFDKIKIPFDRQVAENLKTKGRMYSKNSPFKRLGVTCVGDECCDSSMNYDATLNKCIQGFSNYFDNAKKNLLTNDNIVEESEDKNNIKLNNNKLPIFYLKDRNFKFDSLKNVKLNQNNSQKFYLNDRNIKETMVPSRNSNQIINDLSIESINLGSGTKFLKINPLLT